jgi:hypothetical protein
MFPNFPRARDSPRNQMKGKVSAVGSRYQATAREERTEYVCDVVTAVFGLRNSVRLQLRYVNVQ